MGCILDDQEEEYRSLVRNFVTWSHTNHLQLNTSKTKELVLDFGRSRAGTLPVQIEGEEVEMVNTYKYLGLWVDNKLDWSCNTPHLYKKGQSRLYFLRRLRFFNICKKLLRMFYQSVVAGVLFYAVVCWGSSTAKKDLSLLEKLIRKAGSVVSMKLDTGDSGREKDTKETAGHYGQCSASSAHGFAYQFQLSNRGGRENRWFVEPQLVDRSWQGEMKDGYWLGQDHPDVYLGERQALNEDFTNSGFDRGHLNPNEHHAVPSCNATFTLTNVVPQNPKLNKNAWGNLESQLTELHVALGWFLEKCPKAYMLVGAIPSADSWIVKNNVKRVNIPDYLWNAYCCVDNNDRPIQGGAARAKNTEDNLVEQLSLDEL